MRCSCAPWAWAGLLKEMGAKRVKELDWWQSAVVGGATFTFLPTQHWSRRFGQGYNQSLWGSWMLERGGETIYYGGGLRLFQGLQGVSDAAGPR